tara:strand:- start:2158 stop:2670 length:513 start_codon:yes stop_codon:yes gene_type:complete
LHFSQTSSGIIFIYIKNLNNLQPKQNPKKDSREAKNIRITNKPIAIFESPKTKNTDDNAVIIKPIDWANLFGGPGTIFSLNFKFGTINFVTINAKGLIFGPDDALAKNPYIKMKEKYVPISDSFTTSTKVTVEKITTPRATNLAATSFIVSGKEKNVFIKLSFIIIILVV